MNIKFARDNQEIGEYPEQAVPALLQSSVLRFTDLFWHEGMSEWTPISARWSANAPRTIVGISEEKKKTVYGTVFAVITAVAVIVFLIGSIAGGSGGPQGADPLRPPAVAIEKIVGRYVHSDGVKAIILKEAYGDGGWNGRLSFSPPVGDWAATLRCRVIGTDLVVEIPGQKTTLVKMFIVGNSEFISGRFSPWQGQFTRGK